MTIRFTLWLLLLTGTTTLRAETGIDFNRDIRPILSDNCFQCHGPDANTREAGLRLDQADAAKADLGGYAAIVSGEPEESEILHRIFLDTDDPDHMPPPDSELALTAKQKDLLREWVRQGAEYQEHWSFVPLQRPPVPKGKNPIDHFIQRRLAKEGLEPSPETAKSTLIRRATLDLTGLPPTPEEVNAFLQDASPDAFEKVVDRLLASPHFGERMAWTWLEAARYADTDGYQNDGPREMWRWRDWVIDAYNAGMTFDRFTIEQLAGDLLPNPTRDQIIATGFNRNHRYNSEAGIPLDEFLLENAVDRVDTTSTVWMGMTVACARCHDHKYDPISQREYYQLIDYFNDVPESGRAIKYGNSEPWIKAPTTDQEDKLAGLDAQIAAAEARLDAASSAIDTALAAWSPEPGFEDAHPILSHGLDEHWPAPMTFDGSKRRDLEKVEGLICNGRFTVAFHMTPDQVDSGAVLSSETASTRRSGILVEFADGHLRYHIISAWVAGVATLETERTFQPGERVHVMLTNDGTQRASGMNIFIDGKPVSVRVLRNTNSNKSNRRYGGKLRAGGSPHVGNWAGTIAGLRFYTRHTLTPLEAEILAVADPVEILAKRPFAKRSAQENAKLRAAFLEHAAPASLASLSVDLREARQQRLDYWDQLPTTMVMTQANPPKPSFIRDRGFYNQLGERVEAGVPAVFPPLPDGAPPNRLALARWLVSGDHPLTARVTVNRYWQMLFGRGLVATPEDFGAQGQLPSHPELLDWLAAEFVDSGWDIKHLLKTIVLSHTYRQSSKVSPELLERDPDNLLLARAPRRRMTGNLLRDQALFVSGLFVDERGGPSVKPYQPANLWKEASNFTYERDAGEALYRRSLYTYWKRTLAPPAMALLDTADREWCSVRPRQTNTPLQALTLLNETAFVEAARKFAERILAQPGGEAAQIRFAFQAVTARAPGPSEEALLMDAWVAYRREFAAQPEAASRLLAIGDAPADERFPPVDLAATSALANLLLNLDEVTTRE